MLECMHGCIADSGRARAVRDRLAAAALASGQSLQAYLLGVLEREAAGQENRRLLEK
jgi:hypothetical protein